MKNPILGRHRRVLFLTAAVLFTWPVHADVTSVRLNEVMAALVQWSSDIDTVAGWVELHNPSSSEVVLADASLTDDLLVPRRFVFPPGIRMLPGGFLVVVCVPNHPGAGLRTDFPLRSNGGGLYLFASPADGGSLVDSVLYGVQTAQHSVGRIPNGTGNWTLTIPTPNSANAAATLGSPANLKINEWMSVTTWGPDWFELYNPGDLPVALGGLYLTDDLNRPTKHRIAPLSFLGTGRRSAYALFFADGAVQAANRVNFRLSAAGEPIGLFAADGSTVIDQILFAGQPMDISQGRFPDGSDNIRLFNPQVGHWTASPGAPNPFPSVLLIGAHPVQIEFLLPSNLACTFQYQDNGVLPWLDLTNFPAAPVDQTLRIVDPNPTAARRIYRLRGD